MENKVQTSNFDYINNIFNSIFQNLIIANDKDNFDAFEKLLDFVTYTFVSKSFGSSSENLYSKSIILLIHAYPKFSTKYSKFFIEKVSESLLPIISLSDDNKKISEKYIELSYLGLINILKSTIEKNRPEDFNLFIEKNNNSIFKIDFDKNRNNYLFYFVTILICWIYFLTIQKKIKLSDYSLTFIENAFNHLVFTVDENFINFFYELYDKVENGFWGVNGWEIEAPPKNKFYTALSPHQWLPYGLAILLMKQNVLMGYINIDDITTRHQFKFELEKIKKILDQITVDNYDILDIIFPNKINQEDLDGQIKFRKDKILELFTILKKKTELEDYRKIKSTSLSENKIKEFRNNIGKNFFGNTIIINILKKFNRINYKEQKQEKGIGFNNTIVKGKFAFIDGDKYQEIYGLSQYGLELARNIDNIFFEEIIDNVQPIRINEDLNSYLSIFLDKIRNKDKVIIFASWKIHDILHNLNYNDEDELKLSKSTFLTIPIVNAYNNYEDLLFIVDFDDVNVDIYKNSHSDKWIDGQLFVDVVESEPGNITEATIKEWNENDGYTYSHDEVDILEGNNIDIKILFKSKYEFIHHKNIKVLDISNL